MEETMKKNIWIYALLGILVIMVISVIVGYNSLVDSDEGVDKAQSEVVNRLNQRQDLMGQLIPTVEGLQEHAEAIYDKIVEARKAYADSVDAGDVEGMIEADTLQVEAITQLLIVIEDNPNIHATSAFLGLMDNISAMESALAQARRDYNTSVGNYNTSVRKFPKVLYASLFGFESEKPYWKMNNGADEIPQIDFSN